MKKTALLRMSKFYRRYKEAWLIASPLLLVLFFIILIILGLLYLKKIEEEKSQAIIYHELPLINQKIDWQFKSNGEEARRLIQNITLFSYDKEGLKITFEDFKKNHPEIAAVYYLSAKQELIWRLPYQFAKFDDVFSPNEGTPHLLHFNHINQAQTFLLKLHEYYVVRQIPVMQDSDIIGFIMLLYSSTDLLRNFISPDVFDSYHLQLLNINNQVIVQTQNQNPRDGKFNLSYTQISHQLPLSILPKDLSIKAFRYHVQDGWLGYLFWSVILILVGLIILSLWLINQHLKQIRLTQQKLAHEASFRRALGDSALIGIFALDHEKRVTYVNPALCEMTGFAKYELLGQTMPLAFWYFDSEYENIDQMLFNTAEVKFSEGFERRLQSKNGLFFYGRLYISALMQEDKQTGWLITILDSTETKRAKEELDIAHRRFMIVLESLDLAVSIIIPQSSELLFMNRYYIQNFGKQINAHLELAQSNHMNELSALDWLTTTLPKFKHKQFFEVFLPKLNRWFSVKKQYIQWADGRLAQMIMALDITEFKASEQKNRLNESRWHFSNRLSNLGEMATSFAHELNQPLGAIYNYCHGALTRLKQLALKQKEQPYFNLDADVLDIIQALEKSTKQAINAGDILHKLRNFVKKDALEKKPERILDILNDALILIELSFPKQSKIEIDAPKDLPMVSVDRVLIEQVFVNLIKNAIESNIQADKIDQKNIENLEGYTMPIFKKTITELQPSMTIDKLSKIGKLSKLGKSTHAAIKRRVKIKIFTEAQKLNIWVIDQGTGISEEAKSKLFDAFYTTKQEGIGIGLKICHSIIENHQGRLSAENNQHNIALGLNTLSQMYIQAQGAVFKVQLPTLSN